MRFAPQGVSLSSHKFVKSGDLTVTLTAVDRKGGADTTSRAITVAAADGGGGCGCDLDGAPAGLPAAAGMFAAAAGFLFRKKYAVRG